MDRLYKYAICDRLERPDCSEGGSSKERIFRQHTFLRCKSPKDLNMFSETTLRQKGANSVSVRPFEGTPNGGCLKDANVPKPDPPIHKTSGFHIDKLSRLFQNLHSIAVAYWHGTPRSFQSFCAFLVSDF